VTHSPITDRDETIVSLYTEHADSMADPSETSVDDSRPRTRTLDGRDADTRLFEIRTRISRRVSRHPERPPTGGSRRRHRHAYVWAVAAASVGTTDRTMSDADDGTRTFPYQTPRRRIPTRLQTGHRTPVR
jgi:hypothetical protein